MRTRHAMALLCGAGAALALTAVPASAVATPISTVTYSKGNLTFVSTGNHSSDLRVTSRGSGAGGGPHGEDGEIWTFTDRLPITPRGRACTHPDPSTLTVVTCFVEFGLSDDFNVPVVIHAGSGDDRILDRSDNVGDRVYGELGDDRIDVRGDFAVVDGGGGADYLSGVRTKSVRTRAAEVFGRSGKDFIDFHNSTDALRISGGGSDDYLRTGSGNDTIYGNSGNDRIFANPGNDYVSGAAGNDTIYGNSGNDRLVGGAGVDKISGGPGRNSITP